MYNKLKLALFVQCDHFLIYQAICRPISMNVLSNFKNNIDQCKHDMLCNIMQYIVLNISTYCCQYCLQYRSILFLILFSTLLNILCNFVCNFSNDIVHIAQIERVSIYCTRCTELYKIVRNCTGLVCRLDGLHKARGGKSTVLADDRLVAKKVAGASGCRQPKGANWVHGD